MYEAKVKSLNKVEDEQQIKNICEKLNKAIKKIMNIEPNFIFYGSKEIGYYTVINLNKYNKHREFHLDFRLYYPDKKYFYYFLEAKGLRGYELDELIDNQYNESRILYAYIQWMSVTPKYKGKGSKIATEIIEILKGFDNIELLLLHPIDSNADKFWRKIGFVDENINKAIDKRIKSDACKRLIYSYEE